jgi:CheY-like chemotaxis protein
MARLGVDPQIRSVIEPEVPEAAPALPGPSATPDGSGSPNARHRIVVVDGDDRTRESLVGVLGIPNGFQVVGSASAPREAAALIASLEPDVVVIDLRLPDVDAGLALVRAVRARAPDGRGPRILAFGATPEVELASLDAGAHACARKTFRSAELAAALLRCLTEPVPDSPAPSGPASAL